MILKIMPVPTKMKIMKLPQKTPLIALKKFNNDSIMFLFVSECDSLTLLSFQIEFLFAYYNTQYSCQSPNDSRSSFVSRCFSILLFFFDEPKFILSCFKIYIIVYFINFLIIVMNTFDKIILHSSDCFLNIFIGVCEAHS